MPEKQENSTFMLETERLILRAFAEEDAPSFFDLNNDSAVMQYTGDQPFKSLKETAEFIRHYNTHSRKDGFGRLSVLLKETHTCIGWCGLKRHDDGMVDLGYRLHQKYWNKGYATEASAACLDYGFSKLSCKTILGRTAKANAASIAVLKKIGMKFWKEAPCEGIPDSVFYIIRKETILNT